VQSGNTLFAIALAVNSTVDELKDANCIADSDSIRTGQVLFVPRAPQQPVATLSAGGNSQNLSVLGCANPEVVIVAPSSNERLSGVFTVYGTATRADFWYYKIEVRPNASTIYNFYSDSYTPVVNGVLGQINTTLFGKGVHWVRLSVVNLGGGILEDSFCEVPFVFE
jgi:LysM repeat protein